MIPNTEQTGGTFTTHTVESFITWIDESWKRVGIGSPNDRGFAESHVAGVTEQYGDIAHVMSIYEKHRWGETQVLGRGINSIQMVRKDGRWWITSIIGMKRPAQARCRRSICRRNADAHAGQPTRANDADADAPELTCSTSSARRSASPTDQAWNGQPPAWCGASPSAISATWPGALASK